MPVATYPSGSAEIDTDSPFWNQTGRQTGQQKDRSFALKTRRCPFLEKTESSVRPAVTDWSTDWSTDRRAKSKSCEKAEFLHVFLNYACYLSSCEIPIWLLLL